jgi:hypothetical protein
MSETFDDIKLLNTTLKYLPSNNVTNNYYYTDDTREFHCIFHVESNNYYMELYFPWTVSHCTDNINIDDYNDLIKNFKFNEFICEHLDEILGKVVSERKDINNKVISIAYEMKQLSKNAQTEKTHLNQISEFLGNFDILV